MEMGDRIRIVNPPTQYGFLVGAVGTVERVWKGKSMTPFGILVDGVENSHSKYGIFWLSEGSIKLFKEERHMNKGFSVATVKFLDGSNTGRGYAYALYDDNIAVGDVVVVNTGHHGMAVAKIDALNEMGGADVKFGREVICKVDLTAFNERKQKVKRIAALEAQMRAKVAEVQAAALYEMMAEKSPELRAMLDEYKLLTASGEEGEPCEAE